MLDSVKNLQDGIRTRRMRHEWLSVDGKVCLQRARCFTEVYRQTEGEPAVLRQAKGLDRTLC